ncbi:MAG: hypothetical protein HUJ60_01845, partial [Bacilli bacterium]|nr:hypothetical protein [Bacilli bacterium]
MDANLKKTANIVAKPWVFFLMMFLALAAFGLANLLYDSNEGYASSTSNFDFTSISTDEDPVTRGLSCVADYYENQWVVEDGFPSEKDTVRFPGYAPLQGKTFSGFASYVFTLEGIAEGTEFCLVPNNQPCAYQVYYKFASEPEYTFYFKEGDVNRQFYSFGSGDSVARKYLKSTGEAVTFVYETGFNRTGGIVNHVTFANKQAENRRSFQQITYAIEAAVPISCIIL